MTPVENNTAVNPQVLMEMFGDDEATCTEILSVFLDPSWVIIEEINETGRRLHRSAVTYHNPIFECPCSTVNSRIQSLGPFKLRYKSAA